MRALIQIKKIKVPNKQTNKQKENSFWKATEPVNSSMPTSKGSKNNSGGFIQCGFEMYDLKLIWIAEGTT